MSRLGVFIASLITTLAGIACSGTVPPAATPQEPVPPAAPEVPAAPASSTAPSPAAGGDEAASEQEAGVAPTNDEGPATEEPETAAEEETSEPEQPAAPPPPPPLPSEVLVANGLAFLLDDPSSELKERLAEKCRQRLNDDDPAKLAECRTEERDRFGADVFVFKREAGGIRWIVYQRTRSVLKEVYRAQIKLVREEKDFFEIQPLVGSGNRYVFTNRGRIPVSMPSKHELVLHDPVYGKLIYRAKIGLVGR